MRPRIAYDRRLWKTLGLALVVSAVAIFYAVMARGTSGDEHRDTPPPRVVTPEIRPDARTPTRDEVTGALDGLFRQSGVVAEVQTKDGTLFIFAKRGQCDRMVLVDLRTALAAMDLDPKSAGFAEMKCLGQAANAVLSL